MKLTNFSKPAVTEDVQKIRQLGKLLGSQKPVVEAAPAVPKKKLPVQVKMEEPVDDKLRAHREFAEHQLETSNPILHRKLRHFD